MSTTEPAILVEDVHRRFDQVYAVRGVSFSVAAGQTVGFIGANGAGKTTTMRILATLDLPDSGTVRICGQDALRNAAKIRQRIGWMPDAYGTYENTSVFEYLDFFARAYGYVGSERKKRVEEVMNFTELTPLKDRFIDKLSKGMGQRVCLGRTLLNDPDVLILDEPAAGLDPQARVEFKHLLRLLAQNGKTVFISSHILSELEDMCDTLLFIDSGEIVHQGTAESLKREGSEQLIVNIKVASEIDRLQTWIAEQPGVKVKESIKAGFRISIEGTDQLALHLILKKLIGDGFQVFEFGEHKKKLEDAFIDVVERSKGNRRNRELTGPEQK